MTDGKKDEEKVAAEQGQEEVFVSDDASPQTDSWQDELPPESDLPPEDDFHDVEPLDETGDLPDEESYVEEPAGEDVPDVAAIDKGRGKKILVGAVVVGTVFIGGLAYMQFGGGAGKSSIAIPMGQVINLKKEAEKIDQTPTAPKNAAQASLAAPSNGAADMVSLYAGSNGQGGMAKALPSAQDASGEAGNKSALGNSSDMMTLDGPVAAQDAAPAPATATPPQDMAASKTPQAPAAAVSATPALPPIPDVPSAADSSPLRPVPTALPAVAAPQPALASAATDGRIKALSDQIETLKKALDQAAQQNTDLTKRLETLQQDQTAANEKTALEGRIKQLEQQLATQAAAVPTPVAAKPSMPKAASSSPMHRSELDMLADSSMAEQPVAEQESKIEKTPAAPVKKKRAVSKKKSRSASRRESSRSSVAASGWVLRAATPDTAWVSMGPDAVELRRVTVGETLSGIGKVKEIRQEGDAWALVGTKGMVH